MEITLYAHPNLTVGEEMCDPCYLITGRSHWLIGRQVTLADLPYPMLDHAIDCSDHVCLERRSRFSSHSSTLSVGRFRWTGSHNAPYPEFTKVKTNP
jgi:hypothetical protein